MENLEKVVKDFGKIKVLLLGDMAIDHYIYGKVSGISPEAPVPLLSGVSDMFKLGCAANVANNLAALGGKVVSVGLVGNDENGRLLVNEMKNKGVDVSGIFTDINKPTTTTIRVLSDNQQLLRIHKGWEKEAEGKVVDEITDFLRNIIDKIDGIIIADHDKGLMTEKLIETAINISKENNKPALIDPGLRKFFDYRDVTIFKPNESESSLMTGITVINETSIRNICQRIANQLNCENIVMTRGKKGIVIFERSGNINNLPSLSSEIADRTGVGDTTTAALGLAFFSGAPCLEAAQISNLAGAIKVRKVGTAVVTNDEMLEKLKTFKSQSSNEEYER